MSRKVFVSFLGFTNYGACHYYRDNYKSAEVRYIQEATLEYINSLTPWTKDDVALILLTKGAERANWVDDGQKNRDGQTIKQEGLESRLNKLQLPLTIKPVRDLPDGNNEKEIWEIFERVFECIEENDDLYFDLTHGFRYLPMLILVLGNYSKFLKNVNIKLISYGNYEGRNQATKEALIVDLLPLTNLQDWTYAAGQYLKYGNADQMIELGESEAVSVVRNSGVTKATQETRQFVSALKIVIDERITCRGIDIIKGKSVKKLKKCLEDMTENLIPAMHPIIEKIEESLAEFDTEENVLNGYMAAKWCYENGMYQQAATILEECVVSFYCLRHNIEKDDDKKRDLVNSAFKFLSKKTPEEEWKVIEEDKSMVRELMLDELLNQKVIVDLFSQMTECRNDYNHSGMRKKTMKPKTMKESIGKLIEGFRVLFFLTQE